jgi:hypothetical protein
MGSRLVVAVLYSVPISTLQTRSMVRKFTENPGCYVIFHIYSIQVKVSKKTLLDVRMK